MSRLSIWNSGRKSNDFRFIDRTINEYFNVSGTAVYVHKYLGTYKPDGTPEIDQTKIQDMLFLENRDRVYDKDIIELRGIYQLQDSDFDMRQFGIFLTNDNIFIEFHLTSTVENIGRKLMAGDVLELPHLREEHFLDESKAENKYYVVTDASRASSGYSQTWFPHVWRVQCEPVIDSQEYRSVLDKQAEDRFGLLYGDSPDLREIISNVKRINEVNEAVIEEAKESVSARNFETSHFYVVPGDEYGMQYPWVFAGDGIPPNGAVLSSSGEVFPENPEIGDYCLRTDYEPPALYRREQKSWRRVEIDYRGSDWGMRHRVLESFINNDKEATLEDETTIKEKTGLSKAIRPKTDF